MFLSALVLTPVYDHQLGVDVVNHPVTGQLVLENVVDGQVTSYTPMPDNWQPTIVAYADSYGRQWKKDGSRWLQWVGITDENAPYQQSAELHTTTGWLPAPAGFDPSLEYPRFNIAPYRATLSRLAGDADDSLAIWNLFEGAHYYNPIQNPTNVNPYVTDGNRAALRAFARAMGLSADDADEAAIAVYQDHLASIGLYSEATSPLIIGDAIAHRLADKAGVQYAGLTPEQYAAALAAATNLQDNIKGHREAYEDAVDWQQGAMIISVALPVVSYVAVGAAAAAEGSVAAAGATGAVAGAEAGSWASMLGQALNYVGKIVGQFATKDVVAPLNVTPKVPGFDSYLSDILGKTAAQDAAKSGTLTEEALQQNAQIETASAIGLGLLLLLSLR